MSLPTFAESNDTFETEISDEMYEFLENYLDEDQQVEDLINCGAEYKVFNKDYSLIRFGSLEDCTIKCLMKKCDFLTEVDGTKYYRLNK